MGNKDESIVPATNDPNFFGNPPTNDPHPWLVELAKFILVAQNHTATLGFLFPTVGGVADDDAPRRARGVRQAQVMLAPPLPPHAEDVHVVPNQCQRRLVILISACCSSVVIICLSNLIGPANLPPVPVDLPLDLPGVLDVVNESVGHLSKNVASASSSVCLLEVGLKLVECVCEAGYGAEIPTLSVMCYVIDELIAYYQSKLTEQALTLKFFPSNSLCEQ